jgi:predicted anti-sigma-YlaC factor YlaD
VTQQDEHLTTEQLSAFLDKQLSPAERAVFDAHLASCQQCQSRLADLRLTVALVRALPQEEVPRSFVLPSRLAPVAERPTPRPATVTPVPRQRGARVSVLQRTVRVVSTLAAVLALIFILSGIVPSIHFGGGEAASTAGSAAPAASNQSAASHNANTPHLQGTPTSGSVQAAVGTKTPHPTPKPTPAAKVQPNTGSRPLSTVQPPTLPSFLDLSQPEGRLALGALLLVLGITGLVVTRRRRGAGY